MDIAKQNADLQANRLSVFTQNIQVYMQTIQLCKESYDNLITKQGETPEIMEIAKCFAAMKVCYLSLQQLHIMTLRDTFVDPDYQNILEKVERQWKVVSDQAHQELYQLTQEKL